MAVTLLAWVIDTTQLAVPVQAPDQPTKTEPGAGDAVNVTDDPRRNVWAQSLGQLIPGGVLVTVPSPSPVFSTMRRGSIRTVADEVAVAPSSSVTLSVTL